MAELRVLTGGIDRATIQWADAQSAHTVTVFNGFDLGGGRTLPASVQVHTSPLDALLERPPIREAKLTTARGPLATGVAELSGRALSLSINERGEQRRLGGFVGDVTEGQVRVLLQGSGGRQLYSYASEAAVPSAVLDVVKSAMKVMPHV